MPGLVGAPHAALGLATVLFAAVLVVRFTGRHIALGTAVIVTAAAGVVVGVVRMVLVTSAPILLTVLLLVALIGMHVSPTMARWAAGIRLPVFPSASGRWIFEARPDLPADHAVASGQVATFAGPESVREVTVATDRAHSYLTGLLVATTSLAVVCGAGCAIRTLRGAGCRWYWRAWWRSRCCCGAARSLIAGRRRFSRWPQ